MSIHSDVSPELAQGLELTRRMLELVKAGEWEAVAEVGAERLRLLRSWVRPSDPRLAQQQIGILQEIRKLDAEIDALSRQGRDEMEQRLRQIHQGRKAGKAYKG